MLSKAASGPFASKYLPPAAPLNQRQNPLQTIRELVENVVGVDFEFMGHGPAMPMALDDRSLKLYPPLHVQLTVADKETEYVDYVYLGRALQKPVASNAQNVGWFHPGNLTNAPPHVRNVVAHILALMSD